MVQWFEKCHQLWIHHGLQWDETMFTLSENFLNALMVIHESCKEGTHKVTEFFLYPVGQLAVDPRIYILIQKEAIRKYNLILDKIPVEFKENRRILTSQEGSDIMSKLAAQILEGGDYDLQSSLMEALCRMAVPGQRKKLADRWFSMAHVASAFAQIKDSEFETTCRRFLNMVNGMQGDKRRVYSYPCLEVYLGEYELLMPSDEKLEEFWIDFNLGSHSISFYFSLPDEEEGHWETICITGNEVQSYTVTEESKHQVLQIKLSEVVVVGSVEGSHLTIHFSSSLDILQAAKAVYGQRKRKHTHVVKTAGKTMLEENNTQVVPESQVSLSESEKTTAPNVLSTPAAAVQMSTPAKIRMSESISYISISEGGSVYSNSSLSSLCTSDKNKTSLEKICSRDPSVKSCKYSTTPSITNAVDIKEQKMPQAEAEHVAVSEQGKSQEHYFIPDTQPKVGCNPSSTWSKFSVSEMLMMPTQKIGSFPRPESDSRVERQLDQRPSSAQKLSISDSSLILQKQFHSELTQQLQPLLNERTKDPQYEAATALQKKMSNARRNSKDQSSESMHNSSLHSPKVQQVPKNYQCKEESKGQTSLKVDIVPTKTSLKTCATKTVQERKISSNKEDTKVDLSSKEKRDAKVTSSMVKLISSHYEIQTRSAATDSSENTVQNWIPPLVNRPIFNMKAFSSGKNKMPKGVSSRKSFNKTTIKCVTQRKDTFSFNIDSPVCIGVENKILNNTLDTSNSDIQISSTRRNTTKKAQLEPLAKNKRYVKKHLFSDTDTDNAVTEVSWLTESARKSKPQVTKYTRQALPKSKATPPQSPGKSPNVLPAAPKATKGNNKQRKALTMKPVEEAAVAAPSGPHAAGRRPKRAAATSTKCYRDPDTDGSQSETEEAHASKRLSADKLKNDVKIQEATQTKKKTASRQQTKMKPQPASNTPTTSKLETCHEGKQENREICSKDPQVKKRKGLSDQPAESCRRRDERSWSDLKKQSDVKVRPGNAFQETSKLNKKNVIPDREQISSLKDSLAAGQTSFCPSPPFIEHMRTAERSAPALHLTCSTVLTPWVSPLSASPKPPCQESPSPVPLLPKPHSTVSSKRKCKPSSFYKAEKNNSSSKTKFIQSVPSPCSSKGQTPAPSPPTGLSATEMCVDQQHLSSTPQALLPPSTQALLTSTLLELDKPPVASASSSPLPEDTVSYGCHLDFSKVSSASLASLSHSSPKSSVPSRKHNSSSAFMNKCFKSEETPVKGNDIELTQPLYSGPSRKRHVSSSNSEEAKKEKNKKSKIRTQRSPRMKPRKLFKSFAEASALEGQSNISSTNWEDEVVDEDMEMNDELNLPEITLNPNSLCQQMNSELKNKFQNHCKMMEIYNKQSLKTVQQHVSSINVQLTKHRTQRLEQVKKVILEEIHMMEQDDGMLNNMEKDLTMMWKKQIKAFHSYQKQEVLRNDTLKRTLQGSVHQSLQYEEGIFTSEMGLIGTEMKSVQDRLLIEMQEGEIQSVKRGLRALFFP
ncbi:synaptonemal complex protein 2 [Nematolebias whitei]|uniref:synaptonemal complex protein 2 n=1 Tax=Nematolebias whitei TaxID=451745 RepID=UPI00189B50D3|nr:synaptonemal complex protein 2 [Nematolebias whitei]